ncbi:MAG: 16S rRNA (uracil(1498)-N(3))-methyltransferase [Woeseiaceae bacterium]|nr:16S rRNA (uracil(1498)-N(3))-methyltransferase [Woeseiaceae bacterium]
MKTRLFVSGGLGNDRELVLTDDAARYLGRTLRLRPGDRIAVFNGDDGEWAATITAIRRNDVTLSVDHALDTATESPLKLHLVQGISRGERMDFVVQKATELGVKRITPVLTDHGMVKLDDARAAKRRDHWQRVAISACEQSGRIRPPLVDAALPLNHFLGGDGARDSTELILTPGARQTLAGVDAPPEKLCLLIGPEGGFSDREYDDAELAGFSAVSLGPRILRTETAAVAAITLAQARWGDLGGVT